MHARTVPCSQGEQITLPLTLTELVDPPLPLRDERQQIGVSAGSGSAVEHTQFGTRDLSGQATPTSSIRVRYRSLTCPSTSELSSPSP